jgi:acyl dehydratase
MKFDEFHIGDIATTELIRVTLDDIVDFSTKYDPHYFHIDPDKASSSLFGGIVASGMHSLSLLNAAWVRMGMLGDDIQGGVSLEATWSQPVYPGDDIYGEFTVADKKLNSDGKTGLLTVNCSGRKKGDLEFARAQIKVIVLV